MTDNKTVLLNTHNITTNVDKKCLCGTIFSYAAMRDAIQADRRANNHRFDLEMAIYLCDRKMFDAAHEFIRQEVRFSTDAETVVFLSALLKHITTVDASFNNLFGLMLDRVDSSDPLTQRKLWIFSMMTAPSTEIFDKLIGKFVFLREWTIICLMSIPDIENNAEFMHMVIEKLNLVLPPNFRPYKRLEFVIRDVFAARKAKKIRLAHTKQ